MSFNPAVELSYLSPEQQQEVIRAMDDTQNFPSVSQAKRIKKLAQDGTFTTETVVAIMGEEKKSELDTVTISLIHLSIILISLITSWFCRVLTCALEASRFVIFTILESCF